MYLQLFHFHSIKSPRKLLSWIPLTGWCPSLFKSAFTLRIPAHSLLHPSKACFYYSAQRPAHNAVAWWKFSTTLERSTWQPSFTGTHVLRGAASSIRMTLETLITNMPARPRAHMLWNNKSRRTLKRDLDVRGWGGVVPLQTPSLLFFCCDIYLAGKAFVHALYEPNIFHPIKELLYV